MKKLIMYTVFALLLIPLLSFAQYGSSPFGPVPPSDLAYNAATWNGSYLAPTQNAVRDWIEGAGGGGIGGLDTQLQYNDAGNFAGNAAMTFDDILDYLNLTGGIRFPNDTSAGIMFDDAAGGTPRTVLDVDTGNDIYIGSAALDDIYFTAGSIVGAMVIQQTTGHVGLNDWTPSHPLDMTMTATDARGINIDGTTNDYTGAGAGVSFLVQRDINRGTGAINNYAGWQSYLNIKHTDATITDDYFAYGNITRVNNDAGSITIPGATDRQYWEVGAHNTAKTTGDYDTDGAGKFSTKFIGTYSWVWAESYTLYDTGGTSPANVFESHGLEVLVENLPSALDGTAAATINSVGLYIDKVEGNAVGTSTAYGIYIAEVSGADTNYSIYSAEDASSYLAGPLGIGTATPAGKLHTVLSAGHPAIFGGDALATVTGVTGTDAAPTVLTVATTNGIATGDAVRVNSGTNATVGTYWCTAVTVDTSVTLDRNASSGGAISAASVTYVNDPIVIETGSGSGEPRIVLPLRDNQNFPTLAFGDGNSGFYEYTDNGLRLTLAASRRWEFLSNDFYSCRDNGPMLIGNGGSVNAPAILIDKADTNTGIGGPPGDLDQLSLIAGGSEGIRISEATPLMSYQKFPVDNTHGGYIERTYYATSGTLAGATDKIELNVPSGWIIRAVQLHVKTAVTNDGDNTWSAELNDGAQEEVISAGSAAAQNTNVNHFAHADAGYGGTLTDAETDILLTPQAANFTGGEIEAHALCFGFDTWDAE